jgi:hypothetical protein
MTRLPVCAFAMLLVLAATPETASAQARGRMSGGGPTASPAGRGSGAQARGAMGAAARPPAMTAAPASNRRVAAPTNGRFDMRPTRHVFIPPLYPPYYGNYYTGINDPYGYAPFYPGYPYFNPYPEQYYEAPSQSQNDSDLAYQLALLTREVERLRQDQAYSAPPPPPAQVAPPAPAQTRAPEPPAAPITLVFRDGHRLLIQNYAVVRETLWVLGELTSTRIAIRDLDLDATHRANPGRTLLLPRPQQPSG